MATTCFRLAVTVAVLSGSVAVAASAGAAPSDGTIVFSATSAESQIDQLYSIQTSGEGLKQLTTGGYQSDAPAFSPNGRRIAFQRTGVGILTMNVDGSGLHRVTTNPRDSYPTWSPDGTHIAFVRPRVSRWVPYVVSSAGGRPRALGKAPPAGRPSWTRAGLLIASGGDVLRIDSSTGRVLKYYNADVDPIWGLNTVVPSPSVSMVTYVGARDPVPGDKECGEGACQRFGLYLESLTTKRKTPRLIVKDAGPAAFAPDGKRIVYAAVGKLFIRSVATGASTPISTGAAAPTIAAPPAWR
jgi:dipeptidyl aminopeptidase/acylaminoacyl peptidase